MRILQQISAKDEKELEQKIRDVYEGKISYYGFSLEECNPEIICDNEGNIQIELCQRICQEPDWSPTTMLYSFGKESLLELWEREKWRWVSKNL